MGYILPPPPAASVAIKDDEKRFAVRRIYCVGRNYAAHAREMGKDPDREPPFFFSKPADTVVDDGSVVPYPPQTGNLHFEAELVVAIGETATRIPQSAALDAVWGYGIGNDLTRRDLQAQSKEMGRPWDLAKGFDNSAIIGPLHPTASVGHLNEGRISLSVNGELRQNGNLNEMIWSVAEVIAILSETVTLLPGDLIMMGTPAGVGALVPGDICRIEIEGLGEISTTIGAKAV